MSVLPTLEEVPVGEVLGSTTGGTTLYVPRSDVDICGHHFDDSFITLFKQWVCAY